MRNKRALSVADVASFNPTLLDFEGEWLDSIGKPELTGSWIIYGCSVNGKTRFALQLSKYLAQFRRTAYDSLEEGLSQSIKRAMSDVCMVDVARKFILLDKEPISELRERLRKKKSPDVIFIDSLQYTGMNYSEYKALKDEFRNKLFVFISHADGKEPKGNVAKSIKYDAFVKIRVEGYKAFPESRFGGGQPFMIWEKGAKEYWDYK
jgi:hypothetical protein